MRSLSERLDALKRHEYPVTDETGSSVFGLGLAHDDVYRVAHEYVTELCERRLLREPESFDRSEAAPRYPSDLLNAKTVPWYTSRVRLHFYSPHLSDLDIADVLAALDRANLLREPPPPGYA